MLMLEKQKVLPVTSKNISKQQKLIQIHAWGGGMPVHKSIYYGGPRATKMGERGRRVSETQHNAGLVARGLACSIFFVSLSPETMSFWEKDFILFFAVGGPGERKRGWEFGLKVE